MLRKSNTMPVSWDALTKSQRQAKRNKKSQIWFEVRRDALYVLIECEDGTDLRWISLSQLTGE